MRSFALAAVVLSTLLPASGRSQSGTTVADLDAAVETLRATTGAPGIVVAIADSSGVVRSASAIGGEEEPVDLDTRFRLASVSKAVTAVALARLAEKGTLDLDAPIGETLPDLPSHLRSITPRQLAGHLGGVRHYLPKDYAPGANIDERRFASAREAVSIFADDPLVAEPGAEYRYSTFGYTLLAAVMEAAAGMPVAEIVAAEVGDPLGIDGIVADDPRATAEDRAGFHDRARGGEIVPAPVIDPSHKIAGGGLLAPAGDLARLGAALLDERLLSGAAREALLTPQRTAAGESTGVGLGWRIGEDPFGREVFHHEGSMTGARSALLVYPVEGISVALLSNLTATPYFAFETAASLAALDLRDGFGPCPAGVEGDWDHSGTLNDDPVEGWLTLAETDGGIRGSLGLGEEAYDVHAGWCADGEVVLVLDHPLGLIPLRLERTSGGLEGGVDLQGGQGLRLSAVRAAPADTAYQIEEVRFEAPDGVELVGSLFVPEGEGPFPGAVIIHGSGESDRRNPWADAFARVLARTGVVTLLPDKRGSGESGGEWLTASFEALARDALAGVEFVASRPEVAPDRIGVVGLSQGGHVAPLAADLSDDVAWVVDVSGATVPMVEQIRHEMRNTARQAGLSPEGVEAVLQIQRAAERYVETGEWGPYAAALEAAEGTPWAEVAAGFPQTPESPVWTWARLNGGYDPIPHWKALDVPILVVYGEEDEADNVPVEISVRRLEAALEEAGHDDWRVRVFPGAGHGIWAPDADHSAHDHRLHPYLVDLLTGWIDERFGDGTAAGTAWSSDLSAAVDSLVAARLEADRIPGAAVAFVVDGEIVHAKGYGVADVATGRAVDFDRTLWRIGSTTKALTGLALAALAEREGIDLDSDVSEWLDPGLLPAGEPITIRHLLTHSAGFDQTGLGRKTEEPAPRPTLETFLREQLVRVRPPGAVGVYDTYGITLAGHLIERIGGLAYPAHMRREVFEPLGMTRTWVETPDSMRDDLAVGYGLEDGELEPQDYEWYVTLPASSIDATAADMTRLLEALLTEGGGPISTDLARRVRTEPQLVYGPAMGAFSWAFWEERRAGRRAIHHGGIMAGYSSELYLAPDAGVGFFVAYDRDPETGPAPRLRDALTDFLHERFLPAEETAVPEVAEPVPSERFAGAYGNTVGCFTCDEGEGWGINTLRFTAPEPGAVAMGERRWLAVDSTGFRGAESGAPLRFLADDRGRVRYMVQGPNSFAKLDGVLLDEVLGEGWEDRPPAPLVAIVHRANERWAEAADAYASLAERHPSNGAYAFYEGFAALNAGEPERAADAFERARVLGKWRAWSRYYVGAAHAAMGHADLALDTLETAIEEGFGDSFLLGSEPWWDALREDPRFRELAGRLDS